MLAVERRIVCNVIAQRSSASIRERESETDMGSEQHGRRDHRGAAA